MRFSFLGMWQNLILVGLMKLVNLMVVGFEGGFEDGFVGGLRL